jgi:hypothetical protein
MQRAMSQKVPVAQVSLACHSCAAHGICREGHSKRFDAIRSIVLSCSARCLCAQAGSKKMIPSSRLHVGGTLVSHGISYAGAACKVRNRACSAEACCATDGTPHARAVRRSTDGKVVQARQPGPARVATNGAARHVVPQKALRMQAQHVLPQN